MDTPDVVRLLKELIALPSINPSFGGTGEAAVADFVEEALRRAGLRPNRQEVFSGRDNVFAHVGAGEEPAILLEAHMDTVAADGWFSGSPFDPVEKEGRIYGRGACDTKASLAVFLAVAAHFARRPDELARPLIFAATVDEEEKQSGAFRLAEAGLVLEGAITGEPTLLDIIHSHKGVLRFTVRTRGVAAHSAFPERGENAILRMGEALQRLAEYGESLARVEPHPVLGRPTVNVGTISGGRAVNVVPDSCVVQVDRRLLPNESGREVWEELRGRLADLPHVEVEPPSLDCGGLDTPADSALAIRLGEAVRREKGEVRYLSAPYMTNATAYAANGVPTVVFGPGDIAQAHTRDEYVEVEQLHAAARVLVDFLRAR